MSTELSSAKFYTYLHCKPDGTPFYVGKGTNTKSLSGRRSRNFSRRNRYHKRVVKKYGIENIKIYEFPCDSELQAFADEIQQIAQLRREGYSLTNCTNGGEGVCGFTVSMETRNKIKKARAKQITTYSTSLKMSQVRKGKKQTPEWIKKRIAAVKKTKEFNNARRKL